MINFLKGFDLKFTRAAHIKTKSIGEIKKVCLNSEQGKKLWISVLVCVLAKRNESGVIKIIYSVVVASLRCLVHSFFMELMIGVEIIIW